MCVPYGTQICVPYRIPKTTVNSNNHVILPQPGSWRMFDDIASRYDFLNRLLSFGMDILWRRRLAGLLPDKRGQKVLDVATGTADVLLSLFQNNPHVQSGCGIDLAEKMMDIGRKKIARQGLEPHVTLHRGDANQIPFNDGTFDAATIAFGIRNMEEPARVLREMRRVLNKGGRALVLEFALPRNALIRRVYLVYLRHLMPLIGAAFSGHYRAYKYLNRTIEAFPCGEEFRALMAQAGFRNVKAYPLLFGVASIYQGDKL